MTMRIAVVLPTLLLLQSTGSDTAALLYERGRLAMEQGKAELAARSFRRVRSLCLRDQEKPNSSHLLSLIGVALPKADPYTKDRDKLMASIARSLLAVGRRYIRKGWLSSAKPYVDAAVSLDPSLGKKELEKMATAEKAVKTKAEIHNFFTSLRSIWKLQGWSRKEGRILAPLSDADESTAILAPDRIRAGYRIKLDVHIPDRVSRGGIYFGYQDSDDFHYLELSYYNDETLHFELYHRADKVFKKLESFAIDKKLIAGKTWFPIVLEVRESEISFALQGQILWASLQPDSDLTGKVGLTATCKPGSQGPVGFRDFHFEELAR